MSSARELARALRDEFVSAETLRRAAVHLEFLSAELERIEAANKRQLHEWMTLRNEILADRDRLAAELERRT